MTCPQIAKKYNTTIHIVSDISCNRTWKRVKI